ncbi:PIG-L deacetylase family protein [Brevibacillus sp. BC25]|uniref:PIG-L deacetylase family protein n=1 Tax=Brevibacillus sp. BC25 TaxID=1144308 RepID=UPI0002714F5E|nr:PIG-L family deacetylase [Brevibacillus sp. BC25]EJL22893.1 putative LmbE-like protein [Brevibacillus sp. BC25]
MSKDVLFIAPHPDDETLGCGGTIYRHLEQGDRVHWLIVTGMSVDEGFSPDRIASRAREIESAARQYSFTSVHKLDLPTTKLDEIGMSKIVEKMSAVMLSVQPQVIYAPYRGDVHTDHKFVFDAVISCTKWFRYSFVKRILAYETLSETEFGLNPDTNGFRPNVYVDISKYLERKLEVMRIFESEVGSFPFPRSEQTIRSLAYVRGSTAGVEAAEAFMLLKEVL